MAEQEFLVDFTSDLSKRRLWGFLRRLTGEWRFTVCRYRKRRSDRQNRYYWPVFVGSFARFLRDQGENVTDLEAHEMLKHRHLKTTKVCKSTGEAFDYVRSTTELTTAEFNEYLDRCAVFLAEYCGIVLPDPSDYHEKPEPAAEAA